MSQEKINERKQDKKNNSGKYQTSYGAYIGVCVFLIAFIAYAGYSICLNTGIIRQAATVTEDEKTQLASTLASYDSYGVLDSYDTIGLYKDAVEAAEAATEADTSVSEDTSADTDSEADTSAAADETASDAQ